MIAPKAARRLNNKLEYASIWVQSPKGGLMVVVIGWVAVEPCNEIWISWDKRALVVSTGLGCIVAMNVALTAEHRPAWLLMLNWLENKIKFSTNSDQDHIHISITPLQHLVVMFVSNLFICCPVCRGHILFSFFGIGGSLDDLDKLLEKVVYTGPGKLIPTTAITSY